MGILSALREVCFGTNAADSPAPLAIRNPKSQTRNHRRCQIEELEPRRLFAADVAPHVLLGSVYFEEATGDDSRPDVIQVSFTGGAAGTTLNHLTINGDKRQDGLTDGDVFFDTAAGGLGAFQHDGLSIVSANGFTVNGVTVVDGGSQIIFDLSGFDAGEKLVLSIDADEAQFVDGPNVDANSLVEGAEFQRSILIGDFSAPGYVDLHLTGLYWDEFDDRFATAYADTGLTLDLPNDAYSPIHDYTDRTAGAIVHQAQIPLATLAGWVYHDHNDDGVLAHGSEEGIGGVTLELLDSHGNPTGITTVTSSDPAKLGFYEFRNLFPGTYGVREVQPNGWLDGKDAAGSHGGAAASETAGRVDRIFGAVLNFGDHAVEYNFGELLPGSIRGTVQAHNDPDCDFDHPEIPLEGVRIDLLDANGNFIRFMLTDENGQYEFTDLAPGIYQVREHQPEGYYEGQERVGSAGGTLLEPDYMIGINIGSDVHAINYDFCEHIGVMLSGNVYHDRSNDGIFDRATEQGIGGALLKLFDANGNDTLLRATTNDEGFYKFNNLAAGKYTIVEVQPQPWLDGIDTPGNLGGVAALSPPGDVISQVMINWGEMGTEYNFGELLPGSIAGRVVICDDEVAGGQADIPIPNVRVDLLDGQGNLLDTTITNENGEYSFTNLRPGTYRVLEHQPDHYFDDEAHIGSGDGVIVNENFITDIHIGSAQHLVNYDFCELPPGSIRGRVVICDDEAAGGVDDLPIPNVRVDLLDQQGQLVDITTTNSNGEYSFTNLQPGTYRVLEHQPTNYYDDEAHIGSGDGVIVDPSFIKDIHIGAGQDLVDYDFCELPPSSIRGQVQAHTDADCDFDHPEQVLSGVTIELRDGNGQLISTTTTDDNGEYVFDNLAPGDYQVHELQPAAYYDGEERVGTVGGELDGIDSILNIHLPAGNDGIHYDFCEHIGVMLSGNVYHDRNNDGIFDRDTEQGIGDVLLKLLDANGNDTLLRATTNPAGFYKFYNLSAGKFTIVEVQPQPWLDGIDTPGNLGGVAAISPPGDVISQVMINWGEMGVEYNFGELLPGSISGHVVVCNESVTGGPDIPIPNVRVDLLDGNGQLVATTTTIATGEYSFTNLRPGTYSVREQQPGEYFDDEAHLGDGGGIIVSSNLLGSIAIGSDEDVANYDFCELPPSEICGYVYIDGPTIITEEPLTPEQIATLRDGQRTSDDLPLAGVVIELRHGDSGTPVLVGEALAGSYSGAPTDPIRVTTDASGFYEFTGLPAGLYAVVEVQPGGVTDSLDTPGGAGGYGANLPGLVTGGFPTPSQISVIDQLRQEFGTDAIVLIPLTAGQDACDNNFSEVILQPPPPIIPPPPPIIPPPPPIPPITPPKPPLIPPLAQPILPLLFVPRIPVVPPPEPIEGGGDVSGFTWHLSVVNGGWPRNVTPAEARFQLTSAETVAGWQNVPLNRAIWTFAILDGDRVVVQREDVFGAENATPVTGDFNGDGVTDIGVFVDGQWFLDLNGNGRWDEGDLWARLGTRDDLPVTGDWDADGKTDIGIFGPAWPRDPWAIMREPGLPDADNFPTKPAGKMKNMPPKPEDATGGERVLRRTARGQSRADLIDHVFHYGEPGDVPVAGDWNGDGIRQIGVFHDGEWYLDLDGDGRFTERDASFLFGQAGDLPVVGDFNGDGVDEIGVYRAGKWILDVNGNHRIDAQDKVFELGGAADKPVVGDWNDDGTDDPGVFHPGATPDRVARRAG